MAHPTTRTTMTKQRATHRNNTSGHPGVGWYPRTKKWRAYVRAGGKLVHLGYFDNIDEAIAARTVALNTNS